MTTISIDRCSMPAAFFSTEQSLPNLLNTTDIHAKTTFSDSVPEDQRPYFSYGKVRNILPYGMLSQYDRKKVQREFEIIVMENDHLRAEFMPQFGGRLWSLFDKDHQRDLVHHNPVFQPVNFGLRNAWLSGGVEWNLGTTGHTALTMETMHTSFLKMKDGTPVLRMYEWERMRQISYQLDFYMPDDSRFLFGRVHLHNTRDEEVPLYWWSNTAVNEAEDVRVLSPADMAYYFDYSTSVSLESVPICKGIDRTYTTRSATAMDIFFDIPKESRKWEAALDGKGEGLVQTSTDALEGRKIFWWGKNTGGTHWQEFLSRPGEAYLEIQAGPAKTQMQHLPMPAQAHIEWLEAYGYLQADPVKVHSDDWHEACRCVDTALESVLPRKFMEQELDRLSAELAQSAKIVRTGTGWGALELARRGKQNTFSGEYSLYPETSISGEQLPWLQLLKYGTFPQQRPEVFPVGFMGQKEWIPLLEKAIENGSDHWYAWLHLGVLYYACGEDQKARDAFRTSAVRCDNGWARRNLAMILQNDGDLDAALSQMKRAAELLPVCQIAEEYGKLLCKMKKWEEYAAFYDELTPSLKSSCRISVMRAVAASELNDPELALSILQSGLMITDLEEAEATLDDLWVKVHSQLLVREKPELQDMPDKKMRELVLRSFPLPKELDFRMKAEKNNTA